MGCRVVSYGTRAPRISRVRIIIGEALFSTNIDYLCRSANIIYRYIHDIVYGFGLAEVQYNLLYDRLLGTYTSSVVAERTVFFRYGNRMVADETEPAAGKF